MQVVVNCARFNKKDTTESYGSQITQILHLVVISICVIRLTFNQKICEICDDFLLGLVKKFLINLLH
jgi:hypothetical protein